MNPDGSGATRLTNASASDEGPVWSPDGTRIFFDSDRDGGGVYVMNADGSGLQRLATRPPRILEWSPDRTQILFFQSASAEIWVMTADGSGVRQLTNTDNTYSKQSVSWSPDGTRVMWENLGWIWVVNADGSGLQNLTPNNYLPIRTPAWRPRKP